MMGISLFWESVPVSFATNILLYKLVLFRGPFIKQIMMKIRGKFCMENSFQILYLGEKECLKSTLLNIVFNYYKTL